MPSTIGATTFAMVNRLATALALFVALAACSGEGSSPSAAALPNGGPSSENGSSGDGGSNSSAGANGGDGGAPTSASCHGQLDPTFGTNGIAAIDGAPAPAAVAMLPDGHILVATALGTTGTLRRYDAKGSLDPTFGSAGAVSLAFTPSRITIIEPNGKILVGGDEAHHTDLLRLNGNGSIDASFGANGQFTFPFDVYGVQTARRDDGSILIAGTSSTDKEILVGQIRPNGTVDPSFGEMGYRTTTIPSAQPLSPAGVKWGILQPNGTYVVAGSAERFSNNVTSVFSFLASYTPEGKLDPTFGDEGLVLNEGAVSSGLLRQSNGALVTARVRTIANGGGYQFVRFTAAGKGDPSFGTAGEVSGSEQLQGITSLANDGILAYGLHLDPPKDGVAQTRLWLRRLDHDGKPDPTFGTNGEIFTKAANGMMFASSYVNVAIAPDGGIVVGVYSSGRLADGGIERQPELLRFCP